MKFWLAFILLSPLLLWQARRTRATTPRLPEAQGDAFGLAPAHQGAPLRLWVIGESTAAGVGVQHHHQGLAAHTARALTTRLRRPVHWHTLGVNGIRAAALLEHLRQRPLNETADLAIISLGVNDTTGLTTTRRYHRALRALIHTLRQHHPHLPIYLLALPPMQHFTALPAPLRQLLGHRAARLDREQQAVAAQLDGVYHLAYPAVHEPEYLAEDGYHPSEKGYRYIGERVAERLV
ncbi:GDSL family lipase [Alcanivorax sp. N3-2A]|nr:GDSL family lipase [Alcanivorax sp. N3-2A]